MRMLSVLAFTGLVLTTPALAEDVTIFAAASLKGALDSVAAKWGGQPAIRR